MGLRERLAEQREKERLEKEARDADDSEAYFQGKNAGAKWAKDKANLVDCRGAENQLSDTRTAVDESTIQKALPSLKLADCLDAFAAGSRKSKPSFLRGFLEGVSGACKEEDDEDEFDDE